MVRKPRVTHDFLYNYNHLLYRTMKYKNSEPSVGCKTKITVTIDKCTKH